jgi:phage shock protein C
MIAGVCGGVAEYFDLDPTLVRIGAVVFSFVGGYGIIAYLICWIVVPQKPLAESLDETAVDIQTEIGGEAKKHEWGGGAVFFGALLIIIGLLMVLDNFIPILWLSFSKLWPILIIVVGVLILFKGTGKKSDEG